MDKRIAAYLFPISLALFGCKPDLGDPPYLIKGRSILAIKSEPAESVPGAPVAYSFLLASPEGTVLDSNAGWDICLSPKPPAESNSVAKQCNPPVAGAVPGQTFEAPVPTDACKLFGPIAPPPEPGKPAIRPRDPDSTGGYYLPVRVRVEDAVERPLVGFAFERISCGLANAPAPVMQQFKAEYQPNNNPSLNGVDAVFADGSRLSLDTSEVGIALGSTVVFEAQFSALSQESYPVYDGRSESLVPTRESLHFSWFVTSGEFEHDRTGVEESAMDNTSSNSWTADATAGPVHLWVVMRDSRGGTDFRAYNFQVAAMN